MPRIQQLKPGPDFPLSYLHGAHTDLAAWKKTTRAKVLELMHYEPAKCDPNAEVISRRDRGDYFEEEIRFNTTPVFRVPATVLIPKRVKLPAPGIVALHPHGGFYLWGREGLLEQEQPHPALEAYKKGGFGGRAVAADLARRGFVVIVIDMFYWGERRMVLEDDPPEWKERPHSIREEQVKLFNQRSSASEQLMGRTLFTAGTTWAGVMMWDDLRTLDYFVTRPEVDPARIGCVGHSVGGVRSAHLAALDDRVKATVVCGWMCSFPHQLRAHIRSTVGHTKIIPGLYRLLDYPDLASLAMPRPLMVINGQQDALFQWEGVKAAHAKLARCYEKAGAPANFKSVIEDRPHEFNAERQAEAAAWLHEKLDA
jgi:dienelactone hydrolase